MAAENTTENSINEIAGFLFGRRDIFSAVDKITPDNVIDEVNSAITYHLQNVAEEEYLYWYRRGLQPVLNRTKERNEFVLNKVVENHADEIVTFKNGYFLMEPAFYISRRDGAQRKVDKLNEYLYRSGKQAADNKLADWFHMVGKAVLYVEPNDDEDVPVVAYALDPRSAFVVYSLRPGNKPFFAVNMAINNDQVAIDVFTRDSVYRLGGRAVGKTTTAYPNYEVLATSLVRTEKNQIPYIPVIEYRYNSVNMGAFEAVTYLLDAINNVQSNRVDGIEQFIQSIAVATNCEFDESVTTNDIRKAGMIALRSVGDNKADFRILSEELNQDQTQTLVDNLYDQALRICSMPTTTKGGRSTSDTGTAVIFRDGWEQAASSARNTEDLFRESNRHFDEIFTYILRAKNILDVPLVDFELNFVRNETANVQSKAQAFQTMVAAGLHPELGLTKSGLSNDPVSDYKMSEKYMKLVWGDPDAKQEEIEQAKQTGNLQAEETASKGEAEIVEEDNNNGENEAGGSV